MKTSLTTIVGASAAALALALAPISSAVAAPATAWGVWDRLLQSNADTISFGNASFPDATYTITGNYTSGDVYNVNDESEWFTAETPIGAVFGANGPSTTNNFLKIETLDNDTDVVILTVTFASATTANNLGFAVSDLDTDEVTISATDASGTALTGEQIVGTASPDAFNWCNVPSSPSGCTDTDTPVVTVNASDVLAAGTAVSTDGSTAWFQPSVGVKTITFAYKNDDTTGATSTSRYWFAQKESELPNTGASTSTMLWLAGFGFSLIAAGSVFVARRRRA